MQKKLKHTEHVKIILYSLLKKEKLSVMRFDWASRLNFTIQRDDVHFSLVCEHLQ